MSSSSSSSGCIVFTSSKCSSTLPAHTDQLSVVSVLDGG